MWFLRSLNVGTKIFGIALFFLFIIGGLISYTIITISKQKEDAGIINIAGAQRMLIQKMSKEANQVILGDMGSLESLKESGKKFSGVLNGLLTGDESLRLHKAETPEIAQALQNVGDKWTPFYDNIKSLLENAKTVIESINYIVEGNVDIFNYANEVVTVMGTEQSASEAIATAGRLRALTQRIAKAVLALSTGKGKSSIDELTEYAGLYSKIIDGLLNGSNELNLKAESSEKVRIKLKELQEKSVQFIQCVEVVKKDAPGIIANNNYINSSNLDLLKCMNDAVTVMAAHAESKVKAMIRMEIIISPIAVILGILFSIIVSRQITIPLKKTVTILNSLSEGDFTQKEISTKSRDEVGVMSKAINMVVKNLRDVLAQVTGSAGQVASAASQIHSSGQELAESSHSQASTLEEISATLEEMTSMTGATADNAKQANVIADKTREAAEVGYQQMTEMVKSMDDLVVSSSQISKIIKVIDDIAFQTNLLALNAAVEAARAGEYGKGFAVVAEEVRNLAQRSASASKETSDLIETTVKQVERGREKSNKTVEAFGQIVGECKKTADIVGEITKASQEQAQGISNINVAMTDLDKGTQKIAANAEESASASGELNDQAQGLSKMLEQFKIENNETQRGRKAVTRKAVEKEKPALPAPSRKDVVKSAENIIPMQSEGFEDF